MEKDLILDEPEEEFYTEEEEEIYEHGLNDGFRIGAGLTFIVFGIIVLIMLWTM